MTCETFKSTLADRLLDQAPAQPDDPADAHARHCAECRDAASEHANLLSLVRGLEDLEPDSQILWRLQAAAQTGPRLRPQPLCASSSNQPRRRHRLPPGVIALLPLPLAGLLQGAALAASLTIGIGLSLIATPPSSLPPLGSAPREAEAPDSSSARTRTADPTPDTSAPQVTPSPIGSAHSQCSFVPPPL